MKFTNFRQNYVPIDANNPAEFSVLSGRHFSLEYVAKTSGFIVQWFSTAVIEVFCTTGVMVKKPKFLEFQAALLSHSELNSNSGPAGAFVRLRRKGGALSPSVLVWIQDSPPYTSILQPAFLPMGRTMPSTVRVPMSAFGQISDDFIQNTESVLITLGLAKSVGELVVFGFRAVFG